ncbi:MAG: hypothetical protein JG774_1430 [Desulfomicrobiaceae bacterium]|nr:hypothetical protein [Desulfomicrobiaceae bacterium]
MPVGQVAHAPDIGNTAAGVFAHLVTGNFLEKLTQSRFSLQLDRQSPDAIFCMEFCAMRKHATHDGAQYFPMTLRHIDQSLPEHRMQIVPLPGELDPGGEQLRRVGECGYLTLDLVGANENLGAQSPEVAHPQGGTQQRRDDLIHALPVVRDTIQRIEEDQPILPVFEKLTVGRFRNAGNPFRVIDDIPYALDPGFRNRLFADPARQMTKNDGTPDRIGFKTLFKQVGNDVFVRKILIVWGRCVTNRDLGLRQIRRLPSDQRPELFIPQGGGPKRLAHPSCADDQDRFSAERLAMRRREI